MRFLKWDRRGALLAACACVALGLVFLLLPGITPRTVCVIVAAALLVIGAVLVVDFFRGLRGGSASNGLAAGILAALGALFLLVRMEAFVSVVYILPGAAVIASAAGKAQSAVLLFRRKRSLGIFIIAASVLCLAVGIVLVESPFLKAESLSRATGAGLAFAGITDLGTLLLARDPKE